jgi:hypothetical protein
MAGKHTHGCWRYQELNPNAKPRCICDFAETPYVKLLLSLLMINPGGRRTNFPKL